jgi:hypothetical protein
VRGLRHCIFALCTPSDSLKRKVSVSEFPLS